MRAKLPPEVKAARRREYQQRYREQHREQLRVYGREYYHRMKDGEPKRKRGPKVGTKYKQEPPPEPPKPKKAVAVKPKPKPKPPPKPKPTPPSKKEKGCTKCWLYPCFVGIENFETDFSLTCQQFHKR